MAKKGKFTLPFILPLDIDEIEFATEKKFTLPFKLPLIVGTSGGVVEKKFKLPFKLPIIVGTSSKGERKKVKLPITITCEYNPQTLNSKLKLTEVASMTCAKLPMSVTAWDFKGLILEENVIDKMNRQLTLIEETRSRILVDVELLDKNNIKVKWYGDSVPMLAVTKKMFVDDEFEIVGTYKWEDGEANILIDDNEYNIQLVGLNGTGESGIVDLGESNSIDIKTSLGIALNEKIHDVDIDLISEFKIDINL